MADVPHSAVWTVRGLIVIWILGFGLTWFFMRIHGHDTQMWGLIALIAGPFALPAALVSARRADRRGPEVIFDGVDAHGSRAVAVLLDPDEPALAGRVIAALPDVRRAVLLAVIGPDTIDTDAHLGEHHRAAAALGTAAEAARAGGVDPTGVVLAGEPRRAVIAYCKAGGLELLDAAKTPALVRSAAS